MSSASIAACPCGSGGSLSACCGPLIKHTLLPSTPEALMRSRFTAYAIGDLDYVLYSWHPATRPASIDDNDNVQWQRLFVTEASGTTVTFTATFTDGQRRGRMTERSNFIQINDAQRNQPRWVYVDGIQL